MTFWIVAGAMTVGVAALLALAMLRGRRVSATTNTQSSDIGVYRDQLKEVDRDVARGVLSESEAEQVRIEISRRLLDADKKASAENRDSAPTGRPVSPVAVISLAGLVIAGAVSLYLQIGAPGYPDLPLAARIAMADDARANRPDQATAEAEVLSRGTTAPPADPQHIELVEQLRAAMSERQDDLTGFTLLAQNEAALGNFANAQRAQQRVVELLGDSASAGDYADWADLLILAAGGFVTPEAEAVLLEVLRRDPRNGTALYYSGLLYAQTGRPDRAFAIWRPLLEQSRPSAPWYLPIRAQIDDLAALAGVRYTPPPPPQPAAPGPTADDIAAAQDLSVEDRTAMIEGMVTGLSDRLANDGGTADEWARLITALAVLGRTDEARAIADEARTAFASEPSALPVIEDARRRAGLTE